MVNEHVILHLLQKQFVKENVNVILITSSISCTTQFHNTSAKCKPVDSQTRQDVKADEQKNPKQNKYNINHVTGQVNKYAKIYSGL